MKKVILYTIIVFLVFLSCRSLNVGSFPITGTFYKQGKSLGFNFEYKLELREDGSFYLEEKLKDANPRCEGRWEIDGKDSILLKCDSVTNLNEMLTNSYMNNREQMLKMLSRNRLEYKNAVLKRIN